MNCQEFWDQASPAGRRPDALLAAHLSECPACASAWEAQRNLSEGLRRVAADWSRMGAPARVEARLVAAFREQSGVAAPLRRPWLPVLTSGMAAAAVLVLAVSLLRVREPVTVTPRTRPPNAAILAAVEDLPEGNPVDAAALENGFIPLPNVEQLSPNEPADVVRVELPRSAMMAVGFEVSPERAAEPVEADVMLGPDGVARAVRFRDETF